MPRTALRTYRMTDATLIQQADKLKRLMERDADEFSTRFLGANERTALEDARNAFADTPTDEEYLADGTDALSDVKAIRS